MLKNSAPTWQNSSENRLPKLNFLIKVKKTLDFCSKVFMTLIFYFTIIIRSTVWWEQKAKKFHHKRTIKESMPLLNVLQRFFEKILAV